VVFEKKNREHKKLFSRLIKYKNSEKRVLTAQVK